MTPISTSLAGNADIVMVAFNMMNICIIHHVYLSYVYGNIKRDVFVSAAPLSMVNEPYKYVCTKFVIRVANMCIGKLFPRNETYLIMHYIFSTEKTFRTSSLLLL